MANLDADRPELSKVYLQLQSKPLLSMKDVWDYYNIRSKPQPGVKWWKTSEIVTVLGRNYYYVWNGEKRMRLLRYSVGTTTNGMVEDVRDCYNT